MWEFIFLGLIPGTQIEVTFFLWMIATMTLGVALLAWLEHRTRFIRSYIISIRLLLLTKKTFIQP